MSKTKAQWVNQVNKCCICYNPELDKLIYESKFKLDELSMNLVRAMYYGYSCDKKADDKIKILNDYLRIIEDENRKLVLGAMECLKCDVLQKLVEKIRTIAHLCDIEYRKDLKVDKSGVDRWLMQFPNCASYEKWERLAYRICAAYSLEVKFEKIECDVDFEIFSEEQVCDLAFDITRELIPCDIMVAISVHRQACDLGFTITRTEEECLLDFKILINEVDCDLNFKAYKKLIDCNLTFDIIKTIYENGCSFNIGEPIELINSLNAYDINKFNFKDFPNLEELERLGLLNGNSEYEKNPEAFIAKMKSDYGKK